MAQGQEVGKLHISLHLNDEPFNRGMNTATQSAQSFGGKVRGAAESLFYMGNAASMVTSTIGNVVGGMVDLANQGIAIEKSAFAFDRLAGGAKQADAWIQAIQVSGRGTVTEFEATNQAIQLMTMGLADSADEAGRFMEVAAITQAINPELGTMENTLMNIGLTLANDSWMRLDQLGVDASRAKKRIEELKAEGMAMTDAFDVAVLEQLEENAQKIGTEVLDIGANTAAMQTEWRELKDVAAEFASILTDLVAPAISTMLSGLTEGLKLVTDIMDGMTPEEELAAHQKNYGMTFAEAAGYAPGTAGLPNIPVDATMGAMLGLQPDWQKSGMGALYGGDGGTSESLALDKWGRPITPDEMSSAVESGVIEAILRGGSGIAPDELTGLNVASAQRAQSQDWFDQLVRGQRGTGVAGDEAAGLNMSAASQSAMIYAATAPLSALGSAQAGGAVGGRRAGVDPAAIRSADKEMALLGLYEALASSTGKQDAGTMEERQQAKFNRYAAGDMGSGIAADELRGFDPDAITRMSETMQDASQAFANNMREASDYAESMQYGSLREKWGIDPDSFDVDVYGEMVEALGAVQGAEEAATEAMLLYELQTGITTGAAELFEGQMSRITQQFADGTLTAEEYVKQVQELGQQDFTVFDRVFQGAMDEGDMERINAMLGLMDQVDMDKVNTATEAVGGAVVDLMDSFGLGKKSDDEGELEAATPMQPFKEDMDELDARFGDVSTTWGEPLVEFGAKTMATLADPAMESIASLDEAIMDLSATENTVEIKLDLTSNPANQSAVTDWVLAELDRRGIEVAGATGK